MNPMITPNATFSLVHMQGNEDNGHITQDLKSPKEGNITKSFHTVTAGMGLGSPFVMLASARLNSKQVPGHLSFPEEKGLLLSTRTPFSKDPQALCKYDLTVPASLLPLKP